MTLENTDENWDLVCKAEAFCGLEEDDCQQLDRPEKNEKIYTMDSIVLSYLIDLVEKDDGNI